MPNYQTFKITDKKKHQSQNYIRFELDNYLDYKNEESSYIHFINSGFIENLEMGDKIKIDLDEVKNETSRCIFYNEIASSEEDDTNLLTNNFNDMNLSYFSSSLKNQEDWTDIKEGFNPQLYKIKKQPESEYEEMIKDKIEKDESISDIEIFETWFNPNCAIVIRRKEFIKLYSVSVVIYEPEVGKMEPIFEIIRISKHPKLERVKEIAEEVKKELRGENPALAFVKNYSNISTSMKILENIGKKIFDLDTTRINSFEQLIDLVTTKKKINKNDIIGSDPNDYIKPLDIVRVKRWSKKSGRASYWHVAVYLGKGKNFKEKLTSILSQKSVRENLDKSVVVHIAKNKEESGDLIKRTQYDLWDRFLKIEEGYPKNHNDNDEDLTICHAFIPFKKPKLIFQEIDKVISTQYQKNNYSLSKINCEHLANELVCGINMSDQVENTTRGINTCLTLINNAATSVSNVGSNPGREFGAKIGEPIYDCLFQYENLKKQIEETSKKISELKVQIEVPPKGQINK